jgi:uncharacterized 2Fe-2S/4Fe-4S cluster protein (DUF4445 family)
MSNLLKNNLEKDFEFFVKNITKLQPAEFCGLAKILGVSMVRREKVEGLTKEDIEKMGLDEQQEYVAELMVPMDEVLEKMMDKFLTLTRRRRKEINQILKDVKRGR